MPRFLLMPLGALTLAALPWTAATGLAAHGGGHGGHGGFAHHHGHGYRYGGFYPGFGFGLGLGYGLGYGYAPFVYGGYGYGGLYPAYAPRVVVVVPPAKPPAAPAELPLSDIPNAGQTIPPATTLPPPTASGGAAYLRVRVPADAVLWIDGDPTDQKGAERTFATPELEPGKVYVYEVKARWAQGGQPVEQTLQVEVRAGRTSTVSFGSASASRD